MNGQVVELRVFVVEDLDSVRGLLADLFTAIGGLLVVATMTTEAEAKLWLDDHPGGWDLAIIDLVLEQGSGLGVVSHARRLNDRGKVVVFSSYVSPGIYAHCLRLGADAVFDKLDTSAFVNWLYQQVHGRPPGP